MTLSSDIDIAVKFAEITLKEATEFRKRMGGRINDKIDVQVFNVLPEKIKNEINQKAKKIY